MSHRYSAYIDVSFHFKKFRKKIYLGQIEKGGKEMAEKIGTFRPGKAV